MRNGTRCTTNTKAKMGVPSHMHRVRKVRGGKPVTPIFMIGQLMPQTKVSKIKTVHWRDERGCMAAILALVAA